MSRHSKWHKVRQFKGAIDAKRSASFTKLAREITVAVREKGADPNMNARLRVAIQKAREASMPKDNVERAIQRGTGEAGEEQVEALTYEAYAPGGIALIIECLTDSRNRTANNVKHMLSKNGGALAASGSVTYLFDRVGVAKVPPFPPEKKDELELVCIDAGATDLLENDGEMEIRVLPTELASLTDTLTRAGLSLQGMGFEWVPKTSVDVDETIGNAVAELIDLLEEDDDVTMVSSNMA